MSEPVKVPGVGFVYQASGEVVILDRFRELVAVGHYGTFGDIVDAAARESLSPVERAADRLRGLLFSSIASAGRGFTDATV